MNQYCLLRFPLEGNEDGQTSMRRRFGGPRAEQETYFRPLARRLFRLKPKILHPILNDGDTDGGIAIEAAQVC